MTEPGRAGGEVHVGGAHVGERAGDDPAAPGGLGDLDGRQVDPAVVGQPRGGRLVDGGAELGGINVEDQPGPGGVVVGDAGALPMDPCTVGGGFGRGGQCGADL